MTVWIVMTILLALLEGVGFYLYYRRKYIRFTDEVCRCTECILHGRPLKALHNQESLTSKMIMELAKVENISQYRLGESEKEKKEIQEIISELTHQLKTPLANIRMYNDMLCEPDITGEETGNFIGIIQQQLDKLEFLLETLIKSSRLESNMIRLESKNNRLLNTLAAAVNSVIHKAENKRIEITVNCGYGIRAVHDIKWTGEAIENILDNAVKYTPEEGAVSVTVVPGEMYTEIKIKDTGKGIAASHFNDIYKRFYREKSVSNTEGLGLGLYLARNIITLQGGYISVHSILGEGSCFSVFLPNYTAA